MGNQSSSGVITPVGSEDESDPVVQDDVRLVRLIRTHEHLASIVASYITHHLVVYGEGDLSSKDIDLIYKTTQELARDNEQLFSEFLRDYNSGRRRSDSCQDAPNHRQVIRFIGELFKTSPEPVEHVSLRLQVLDTLCQLEENREYFIECKMAPLILGVMAAHAQTASIQQYGCQVLAELASSVSTDTLKAPMREGGVELVVKAMNNHRHRLYVVRPATSVLANLTETVENLIQHALKPADSEADDPELVDKLARLLGLKEFIRKTGLALIADARILYPNDVTIQIQAQRICNILEPEQEDMSTKARSKRSASYATITDITGPKVNMRRYSDYAIIEDLQGSKRRGSSPGSYPHIHEVSAPGRPKCDLYSTIDDLVGPPPGKSEESNRRRGQVAPVPHIVVSKDYATIEDATAGVGDSRSRTDTSPNNGYASIDDLRAGTLDVGDGQTGPVAPPRRTRSLKSKQEPVYATVNKTKPGSAQNGSYVDDEPIYAVVDKSKNSRKTSTQSDSTAWTSYGYTDNTPIYATVNKPTSKDPTKKAGTLGPGADRSRSSSIINIMPFQTKEGAVAALDKAFKKDRKKSSDSDIIYNPKYKPRARSLTATGEASLLEASTLFADFGKRSDSERFLESTSEFEDNLIYEEAGDQVARRHTVALGLNEPPSISLTDEHGNSVEEVFEKVPVSFVKKSRDRLHAAEHEMEREYNRKFDVFSDVGVSLPPIGGDGGDADNDIYSTIDADVAGYHARTATGRPSIMLAEDVRLKPTRLAKLKQVAANIVHHNKHTAPTVKVGKETEQDEHMLPVEDDSVNLPKSPKSKKTFLKKALRRVKSTSRKSNEPQPQSHIDNDNPDSSSIETYDGRRPSEDGDSDTSKGRYLKNKLNQKGKEHYGSSDTLSRIRGKKTKQRIRTSSETFGSIESIDAAASDDSGVNNGKGSKVGTRKKRNVIKQLFRGKKIKVKEDKPPEETPPENDLFRSSLKRRTHYPSSTESEKEEEPPATIYL